MKSLMKSAKLVLTAAWLVVCAGIVPAAAQTGSAPVAVAPGDVRELSTTVVQQYNSIKSLLIKTVDAMPADAFGFQPVPEMRTFAGTVGHLVSSNIGQCSALLGKKHELSGQDLSKTLKTKEEAVKAIADSYAFCDEFFTTVKSNAPLVDAYYTGTMTRNGAPVPFKMANGGVATGLIAHNNEEYGYLAVYLRLKGVVPPSSVPPVKK
jgi:hypothetical protein